MRGFISLAIVGCGADREALGKRWKCDLLVAGATKYDNDDAALLAIFREWTRLDAGYLTRVDHLRGVKSGGNGTSYLNGNTVVIASVGIA